ncbi:MAG: ribulokinase [Bacteroidetes bacterium]|nr:ribulokinase [Bacteroidota bacterium]
MNNKYVIGIDYGTDSVRSLIIDTSNGNEISSSVFEYPRWKDEKYCDPEKNRFRQHPADYIEGLEKTVREALGKTPEAVAGNIVAISVDTTGSTPVAVNIEGKPLSLTKEFENNPNAMFILWKDHTAVKEAEEINNFAHTRGGMDYTKYEGGVYSSEWFWAKILHILREDKNVREKAFSWVEHCDWIPALLNGDTNPLTLKRSRCAAGHKAMWHKDFKGLPSEDFLVKLDPLLKGLRKRLYEETYTCDVKVGNLSDEWAERLRLSKEVSVGVGAFDAHLGAVGGEIKPGYMSKVMGTSTCDMMVSASEQESSKLIKGICGQVDGSIIPGMLGMEAGQSAFGDVYAWFKNVLLWPVENVLTESELVDADTKEKLIDEISGKIIPELSQQAEKTGVDESGIIALDWLNGRRTPDANQNLKGAVTGLNLGSDAPKIFRALVEATAFGAKKIADRFISEGVEIKGVIALGGVAKKSPFVMQVVADVMNMPIKVARAEQTCALGSAMAASVVGGVYNRLEEAQEAMGRGFESEYVPDPENAKKYEILYNKYSKLGEFAEENS